MACNSCGKKKKTCDSKEFTKAVVEINNPETNVLIRKVVIPTSLGDDVTNPPAIGRYCNVVLYYEANQHIYLYSSDGIPTLISDNGDVDFNYIQNRPWYNGAPMTSGTRIPKVPTAVSELNNDRNYQTASQVSTTVSNAVAAEANIRQGADETLRNDIDAEVLARQNAITTLTNEINRDVMYDLEMTTSAQSVSFQEDKINVVTGHTTTEIDTIPAASKTTAGIITAAEYTTLVDAEEKINALLDGAVAITGISANPSQQDLTTAWKNATGRDELINRASIFDVDNQLVWTYYTNASLWESVPAGGQVTINQFENGVAGTITGSTLDGNVSANLDGTGSVSGWTTVKNDIATNTAAIATKANITDIPTVNNATLTIQKNGSNVATFTANSATNATANITVPTIKPENFFTNSATDSDKGNPLYFEDTTNEKLVNIMLEGDTDQTTYSGKNLVFTNATTAQGITATYDATTGVTTTSGTATQTYAVFGTNTSNLPAGTYTFSIQSAAPVGVGIGARVDGGSRVSRPIPVGNTSITFTVTGTITSYDIYITNLTAGTTYNFSFKAMLEAGSSATSFEPYVGGTASPNPDYPQDVINVTGEQVVKITGKNLLDNQNPTVVTSPATWTPTQNGGTYTSTQSWKPVAWNFVLEEGASYKFRYKQRPSNDFYVYIFSYTDDTYSTIKTRFVQDGNATQYSFTPDSPYVNVRFMSSAAVSNLSVEDIQLEKSASVTEYEPYEDQEYTINLGKNLLDLSTFVKGRVDNGVVGYPEGTTSFSTTDEDITFTTNTAYRGVVSALTPVHPNTTYLISAENSIARLTDYYDQSGNWISRATTNPFVTPANCYFIRVSYQPSTVGTFTVTKPQLEIGTSRTTFAPYITPIELCKIGDYQDYFYKDGDDWYIHKEIGKVDLSTLTYTTSGGNKLKITTGVPNIKYTSTNQQVGDAKAEQYTVRKGSGLSADEMYGYFAVDVSQVSFNVGANGPNPVGLLYYALATPTNTKITDSSLIEQLDTLWNGAHSYDNVTWIFAQSNGVDLPFIIDATVVENSLAGVNYVIDNKQDILTAGDNITITNNVISASVPTVNNATLTIQKNGTNVATFTANSSTNATANITVPTITMTNVDPGEGSPLAANNFIAVYEA